MPDQKTPVRILFLCTENSARSQMAEALARELGGRRVEALSAGVDPRPIHPLAIQAMHDVRIDMSHQQSKHWQSLANETVDFIVTVCDRLKENCPSWPGTHEIIHWSIEDPAAATGSEQHRLDAFARAARELRNRVTLFLLSHHILD